VDHAADAEGMGLCEVGAVAAARVIGVEVILISP